MGSTGNESCGKLLHFLLLITSSQIESPGLSVPVHPLPVTGRVLGWILGTLALVLAAVMCGCHPRVLSSGSSLPSCSEVSPGFGVSRASVPGEGVFVT